MAFYPTNRRGKYLCSLFLYYTVSLSLSHSGLYITLFVLSSFPQAKEILETCGVVERPVVAHEDENDDIDDDLVDDHEDDAAQPLVLDDDDDRPVRDVLPLKLRQIGEFLYSLYNEDWDNHTERAPTFEIGIQSAAFAGGKWVSPNQVHHYYGACHFQAKLLLAFLYFYHRKAEAKLLLKESETSLNLQWTQGEVVRRHDVQFSQKHTWTRSTDKGITFYFNNAKASHKLIIMLLEF